MFNILFHKCCNFLDEILNFPHTNVEYRIQNVEQWRPGQLFPGELERWAVPTGSDAMQGGATEAASNGSGSTGQGRAATNNARQGGQRPARRAEWDDARCGNSVEQQRRAGEGDRRDQDGGRHGHTVGDVTDGWKRRSWVGARVRDVYQMDRVACTNL